MVDRYEPRLIRQTYTRITSYKRKKATKKKKKRKKKRKKRTQVPKEKKKEKKKMQVIEEMDIQTGEERRRWGFIC